MRRTKDLGGMYSLDELIFYKIGPYKGISDEKMVELMAENVTNRGAPGLEAYTKQAEVDRASERSLREILKNKKPTDLSAYIKPREIQLEEKVKELVKELKKSDVELIRYANLVSKTEADLNEARRLADIRAKSYEDHKVESGNRISRYMEDINRLKRLVKKYQDEGNFYDADITIDDLNNKLNDLSGYKEFAANVLKREVDELNKDAVGKEYLNADKLLEVSKQLLESKELETKSKLAKLEKKLDKLEKVKTKNKKKQEVKQNVKLDTKRSNFTKAALTRN